MLFAELATSADYSYEGYYFNFLGRTQVKPLSGTVPKPITTIPGKLLSLTRRLGFQLPLELFTSTRSCDVIMSTNYVSLPAIRKRTNVLFIYDLSFLDCPEYTQPANLKALRRFCPKSIQRADLIITISEFTRDRILHFFPDIQAGIVITPIPPIESSNDTKALPKNMEAVGLKKDNYLLYVGTIEPRKNLLNLVEAYVQLPKTLRDKYALVLAGGNGWKNEETLARIESYQKSGEHIILTGYVSDDTKLALYQNARCFVMPSHYEGFGMPIFEAFQQGLPVAASDIPVFREIAKNGAAYFDKDDPSDIASTLQKLLIDNGLRTKLIANGRKRLHAYSWDQNARLVSEALSRLVKKQ